jgi:hypothetical protein
VPVLLAEHMGSAAPSVISAQVSTFPQPLLLLLVLYSFDLI